MEMLATQLASGKVVVIPAVIANAAFDLGYTTPLNGTVQEARAIEVKAHPEQLWEHVAAIGGGNGWYYADWAWTVRGWIDRLLGGVGTRRERPESPTVGDQLDMWVVERWEPKRDLTLRSGWRMPKLARMGLHVRPHESRSVLVQWVEFHPNLLTWIYWWATYPLHRLMFRRLLEAIASRVNASA